MRIVMIAALAAAQLSAAAGPALAAELPPEVALMQARLAEGVQLDLQEKQIPALAVGAAPAPLHAAAAAQEEEGPRKKKRKSTGDKVLTGAAVVLGIGALAVGGLLVAIFVN